jgi:hypothetical protein
MSDEMVGIIRNVGIGMRDCHAPVLWFDVYISEHSAALQVFSWGEASRIITESQVYDVKTLEGKPCWVSVEGTVGRIIKFVRMWKP